MQKSLTRQHASSHQTGFEIFHRSSVINIWCAQSALLQCSWGSIARAPGEEGVSTCLHGLHHRASRKRVPGPRNPSFIITSCFFFSSFLSSGCLTDPHRPRLPPAWVLFFFFTEYSKHASAWPSSGGGAGYSTVSTVPGLASLGHEGGGRASRARCQLLESGAGERVRTVLRYGHPRPTHTSSVGAGPALSSAQFPPFLPSAQHMCQCKGDMTTSSGRAVRVGIVSTFPHVFFLLLLCACPALVEPSEPLYFVRPTFKMHGGREWTLSVVRKLSVSRSC